MGVADEVLREKGEKKKKKRELECSRVWRKCRDKKRKEVKKEKSKGTCVEEKKKRGKKRRKYG